MGVERPPLLSSPRRRATPTSTTASAFNATAMLVSNLVTVVESGEFNMDQTASMDSTPFCRVCLNDNHILQDASQSRTLRHLFGPKTKTSIIVRTEKRAGANSFVKPAIIVSIVETVRKIATVPRRQIEVGPRHLAPETTITTIKTAMMMRSGAPPSSQARTKK